MKAWHEMTKDERDRGIEDMKKAGYEIGACKQCKEESPALILEATGGFCAICNLRNAPQKIPCPYCKTVIDRTDKAHLDACIQKAIAAQKAAREEAEKKIADSRRTADEVEAARIAEKAGHEAEKAVDEVMQRVDTETGGIPETPEPTPAKESKKSKSKKRKK